MSLMDSLGLDAVEADPNAVPDGKYNGEVFKDEYVHVAKDDSVSHVLTYRVTEGEFNGAQRPEWFKLGTNPQRDENGNIVGLDITMTETQKRWYKKRLLDLGVPEQEVSKVKPGDLTGRKVTFGVKRNGQYININFAELRKEAATPQSENRPAQGSVLDAAQF